MDARLIPLLQLVAPAISVSLVLVFGRPVIALLRRIGAVQRVRNDGPQRHLQKEGTPTMGGVLLVVAAVIAALVGGLVARLWSSVEGVLLPAVPALVIGVTLAFAGIGLLDDWLKITRGRSLGLRARQKLALQMTVAIAFYLVMIWLVRGELHLLKEVPPWSLFAQFALHGVLWTLVIVATANAVNLADGLDGLAAGLCTIAFIALAAIGLARFHQQVVTLALALAGACLGFLWFNRHPARLFMGDVGSLALGAALAALTLFFGVRALIGVCLVPFVEEASVIAQVIAFKATGKRIFKMSPIHHHFELSGWSERRVVWTFWAVALAAAVATVVFTPIIN